MRVIETQNENYNYYTPQEAKDEGIEYKENWREGNKGDWVLTDDGWVVRVLYRKRRNHRGNTNGILRIATGTFPTREGTELHTEHKGNRFTISGRSSEESIRQREPTFRDKLFIKHFLETGDEYKAASIAYNDRTKQAQERIAANLIVNKKVRQMIKDQVDRAATKHGVTYEYIIKGLKEMHEVGEKEKNRLSALKELGDIIGIKDKEEKQTTTESFSGFSSKDLPEGDDGKQIPQNIGDDVEIIENAKEMSNQEKEHCVKVAQNVTEKITK